MQMTEYPEQTETIDLRQYLVLLWQWAWLIALAVVLAAAAAYFFSSRITPVYQATTTVLVNEAPATQKTDYTSIITSQQLTSTYSQMMTKQPVLAEVAQRLGIPEVTESITVSPVRDTQLMEVAVESTDPVRAAQVANTLVAVFSDQIQSLQEARFATSKENLQAQLTDLEKQIQQATDQKAIAKTANERDQLDTKITQYRGIYSNLLQSYESIRLAEAETTSSVTQVEPATPAQSPIRPRVMMNVLLAAVVGALLAIGAIVAVEALDDTLKSPEDVTRSLGLPILGVVSHYRTEDGSPVAESQPRSPISEAFRTLRTNVMYAGVDKPINSVLVTSASPGEGKTTIVTNLAVVFAQSGRRVVVIDADLRRPALHRRLGLGNQYGLSQVFVQSSPVLNGSQQKTRVSNLTAVTSGSLPPNPSELLGSQKMGQILSNLRKNEEMVILDTPPALAVTDAAVLVPYVDGVLLVVKPGSTKTGAAKQAIENLRRVGANLLGVVLNDIELRKSRYSYYYYKKYHTYNSYGYGEGDAKKEPKSQPRKVIESSRN